MFASMRTQFWPPKPNFTENNVSSQKGKVFIVTGGNQGVGFELIKMLYPTGATIYMASRSKERAEKAIEEITSIDPSRHASLKFLQLDLSDLDSNNAGIGAAPTGTKTKQGLEANIGVNAIGPLLFTQLLMPLLQAAASSSRKDSVRIVWSSSHLTESQAPTGGVSMDDLKAGGCNNPTINYSVSKAANWMLAIEAGQRWGKDGIVSVAQNPGNLKTHIYDGQPWLLMLFVNRILHPQKFGAYTELYAGLSEEVKQGDYVIPWGRVQERNPREDIYQAIEKGKGKELWDWCDEQIRLHT